MSKEGIPGGTVDAAGSKLAAFGHPNPGGSTTTVPIPRSALDLMAQGWHGLAFDIIVKSVPRADAERLQELAKRPGGLRCQL